MRKINNVSFGREPHYVDLDVQTFERPRRIIHAFIIETVLMNGAHTVFLMPHMQH